MSTESCAIDAYVIDVLMPDLVGHDRSPAAFVVYLFLLRQTAKARRDSISMSLQTIAAKTGLSKSSVQLAIRRLNRRKLVDSSAATIANPQRRVLRPWLKTRAN
ncbi:MAG TPA: helix-turn-helix domain-containing protein [Steroidobacteraceae bacterium]|nr:helix-turn-helix domain-containing protein [Steroidobacteraceae bacterium]